MIRLFLGQLPYNITDECLNYALGIMIRSAVYYVERIVKKGKPTGCLHAYCVPAEAEKILSASHRVLFDEVGFWWPLTEQQSVCLSHYISYLSANAMHRPACLPYQSMTVEQARSTYVPFPSRQGSSILEIPDDSNMGMGLALTSSSDAAVSTIEVPPMIEKPSVTGSLSSLGPQSQTSLSSLSELPPPTKSTATLAAGAGSASAAGAGTPQVMHHSHLRGIVDFHPFPAEPVGGPLPHQQPARESLVRLFVGQLPYTLSEASFVYAVMYVTNGCHVYHIERILKKGRPAGCLHTYCLPSEVDAVLQASHRILFDDGGFWVPSSDSQLEALREYIEEMSRNEVLRPVCMPFQTMTVEISRSNFVPFSHQVPPPPPPPPPTQEHRW